MKIRKFNRCSNYLLFAVLLLFILILAYWKYKLGLKRYFDLDEFAHIRWTHNIFTGQRPYKDFFYIFFPSYYYILLPIFIFAKGASVLLAARTISFLLTILTGLVLFFLSKQIKDTKFSLITLFIFFFLPIPSDKWLEVRPDGFAILVSLLGYYFLVKGLKVKKRLFILLSGVFSCLGVIILPKLLPFLALGILTLILSIAFHNLQRKIAYYFLIGMFFPGILLLFLLIFYGDVSRAIYIIMELLPKASFVLGKKFPLPYDFYFWPNDVFYGKADGLAFLTNKAVWVIAIFSGFINLIISFLSIIRRKNTEKALIEFLISSTFIIEVAFFVWFFPLKHMQYLMPASVFVAYYFADFAINYLFRFASIFKNISLIILISYLFFAVSEMYFTKLTWNNQNLPYLERLSQLFSENTVFDLSGETIDSMEGYYFCCVPYGQYEETLNFPFPDLESELYKRKTKIVYIQNESRLMVIPAKHQEVIKKYFTTPLDNSNYYLTAGASLNFEPGKNLLGFDLLFEGKYKIIKKLPTQVIYIDGKLAEGDFVYLSRGEHLVSAYSAGEIKLILEE